MAEKASVERASAEKASVERASVERASAERASAERASVKRVNCRQAFTRWRVEAAMIYLYLYWGRSERGVSGGGPGDDEPATTATISL
jgi:hypothetical protein